MVILNLGIEFEPYSPLPFINVRGSAFSISSPSEICLAMAVWWLEIISNLNFGGSCWLWSCSQCLTTAYFWFAVSRACWWSLDLSQKLLLLSPMYCIVLPFVAQSMQLSLYTGLRVQHVPGLVLHGGQFSLPHHSFFQGVLLVNSVDILGPALSVILTFPTLLFPLRNSLAFWSSFF